MRTFRCWLFGCDVKNQWDAGTRYSPSREKIVPCMRYYCARCGTTEDVPGFKGPDRRNLYQRTIPFWIMRSRNRRYNRQVAKQEKYRQSEAGRAKELAYLDEQMEKLKDGRL